MLKFMPTISFVIPARNRKQYTQHILSQIDKQISQADCSKNFNFAVIVVDDGSTDGTREVITAEFPSVCLIKGDGSLWWTGAIVEGMKYAIEKLNTDYIIWLNDDISLADNFIQELSQICQRPNSQKSVIGGIVRDSNYSDWLVFSGVIKKKPIRTIEYLDGKEEIEIDTLNGNITVIPRQIVDQIGWPDKVKFRHYGGDFDFGNRAKKAGFKIILSSRLQATTDFQIPDLIRYMPAWMQWRLQKDIFQKYKILKGFTNLKCHYNVWHKMNIIYGDSKQIPWWRYITYYFRQILKVLVSNFWLKSKVEREIKNYLQEEKAPQAIIDAIMYQIGTR